MQPQTPSITRHIRPFGTPPAFALVHHHVAAQMGLRPLYFGVISPAQHKRFL